MKPTGGKSRSLVLLCLFLVSATGCRNDCSETPRSGLWERVFEERTGYTILTSADGNYLITGEVRPDTSYLPEPALFKVDDAGTEVWSVNLADNGFTHVAAAAEAMDFSILVAGFGLNGPQLARIGVDGTIVRSRRVETASDVPALAFRQLSATTDGYVVAVIDIESPEAGDVVKLDLDGNIIWTYSLDTSEHDGVLDMAATDNSGVVLLTVDYADAQKTTQVGKFLGAPPSARLLRLTGEGTEMWSVVLPPNLDYADQIEPTNDGGVAVFASDRIALFDRNGQSVWNKEFLPAHTAGPFSFSAIPQGGFIVGTSSATVNLFSAETYQTCGNSVLIRVAEGGEILWERAYGSGEVEKLHDVSSLPDGGYILVGARALHPTGSSRDMFLRQIAPDE